MPVSLKLHTGLCQGNDHSLRYLALKDNRYLRYFQGHTARVTSLCMSPKSDMFISTAQARPLPCLSELRLEPKAMRIPTPVRQPSIAHWPRLPCAGGACTPPLQTACAARR